MYSTQITVFFSAPSSQVTFSRLAEIFVARRKEFLFVLGTLKGFDQTINLILDETHERVFSSSQGIEQASDRLSYLTRKPMWLVFPGHLSVGILWTGCLSVDASSWIENSEGMSLFI